VAELDANADTGKLEQSLKALVNRHHILRTVYVDNTEGTTMQHVVSAAHFEVVHMKVAEDANIREVMSNDVKVPFSLDHDVPIRATMYQQGQKQLLLLNFHHIAFDGWSLDILWKEWETLYSGGTLAPLELQYTDFAAWENEQLERDSDDIAFWKQNLAGAEPVDLGSDVLPSSVSEMEATETKFELGADLSEKLRALAKEFNTTMYTTTLILC
jgi:hypothetical protein